MNVDMAFYWNIKRSLIELILTFHKCDIVPNCSIFCYSAELSLLDRKMRKHAILKVIIPFWM